MSDKEKLTIVSPQEAGMINAEAARNFEKAYHELIFAVERKFPNETRHETALRYIRNAEIPKDGMVAQEPKL